MNGVIVAQSTRENEAISVDLYQLFKFEVSEVRGGMEIWGQRAQRCYKFSQSEFLHSDTLQYLRPIDSTRECGVAYHLMSSH